MTVCKHLAWLHVTSGSEVALLNPNRLARLVQGLPAPTTQRPSVISFVGRKTKSLALREIFHDNNFRKRDSDGVATLRIDNTTFYSDHPILFAESYPTSTTLASTNGFPCHESKRHPLLWAEGLATQDLYNILQTRLLCLFTDVLCIFADDFPIFQDVIDLLEAWAAAGSGSNTPQCIRPRVIIIEGGNKVTASSPHDFYQTRYPSLGTQRQSLQRLFPSILIQPLMNKVVSPLVRFGQLKKEVWRQMDEIRRCRQSLGHLYSATHLSHFFQVAVEDTVLRRPFNYIHASRHGNELPPDYKDYLTSFLRLGAASNVSYDSMAAYIASSILLDAYPPGMHRFNPESVFDALYRQPCMYAFMQSGQNGKYEESVLEHFDKLFLDMTVSGESAADIHSKQSGQLGIDWRQVWSNTIYLWCLGRRPEHHLSCGHSVCDRCLQIHGEEMPTIDYEYAINACILCRTGNLRKVLVPPSAGLRILTLDGGGSWGRLTLEIINVIQNMMGSSVKFQDLFDLVYGTSIGGISACELCLCGLSIARCIKLFEDCVRQIFEKPTRGGILSRIRYWVASWYADGCYDASNLEYHLKASMGLTGRMFDHHPTLFATKVGVTVTTIKDPSPVVLTNYNGPGARNQNSGYKHYRPEDIEKQPCIWEAGRATSAALLFFKTAYIDGIGPVQDGGMSGHNNPVIVALWESRRIKLKLSKPDIVVSLGTGIPTGVSSLEGHHQHPMLYRFGARILYGLVARLCQPSLKVVLDCEGIWTKLMNSLDEESKKDYFRLNVILSGRMVIDDVDRLDEMQQSVHHPQIIEDCKRTLYAMLVSSFYFELSGLPEPLYGRYRCQGAIRCRLPGNAVAELLARNHPCSLAFMASTRTLGYYDNVEDFCPSCRRYRKQVAFSVRDLDEVIEISVQSVTWPRRAISAFPQSMQWFLNQQELGAVCGTAAHRGLRLRSCRACFPQTAGRHPLSLKRKISNYCEDRQDKKLRAQ